ncbi:hypothetical protein MHYP_G00087970 [Metynnis hypsauchen]
MVRPVTQARRRGELFVTDDGQMNVCCERGDVMATLERSVWIRRCRQFRLHRGPARPKSSGVHTTPRSFELLPDSSFHFHSRGSLLPGAELQAPKTWQVGRNADQRPDSDQSGARTDQEGLN